MPSAAKVMKSVLSLHARAKQPEMVALHVLTEDFTVSDCSLWADSRLSVLLVPSLPDRRCSLRG